jgi:hypothetical protein
MNSQSKVLSGNVRLNNPGERPPRGAKLKVPRSEKPVNVGEENVTMEVKSTKPADTEQVRGEEEHGEGTVKVKVNDAPGAETAVVEVSDAYVLVTV